MKAILFIIGFSFSIILEAQDTLQFVKHYDKTKTFWLASKTDTTMYSYYPNGKKESERKYNYNGKTVLYKRWYENGKIMWERETVNEKPHGKTVFYSDKGLRVAELKYENGEITDTVFINENIHLVLGKITFRSVVYGGAVNADGTSNVSDYSGPWMYNSMYAAVVDSLKKPELIQNFRSDHNGEFFILAPIGKVGYFPITVPIDKLNPGEYYPVGLVNYHGHDGWNLTSPQIIKNNDKLLFILIHRESVGYAP